ncbi:hypothetical protein [Streptomyces sp. NPDC058308]|uniref:hypothetical protein n=1 Tax=Streptomyces sp. NPDC058308 TaxID=3346440 RepID=UPI0036E741A4
MSASAAPGARPVSARPVSARPRIALISATPAAAGPAVAGLAEAFPRAEPWNLLDDALLTDAEVQGGLTPGLAGRMRRLIDYAVQGGARGVLLTCSLYGPVAERADAGVPVLAADAAAFAAALAGGHRRVLVLATFDAALGDSLDRFRAVAAADGSRTEAVGQVIRPGELPDPVGADAVLLAQYSLAPRADELSAALRLPVYAGPRAAAHALRAEIEEAEVVEAEVVEAETAEGATPCSE